LETTFSKKGHLKLLSKTWYSFPEEKPLLLFGVGAFFWDLDFFVDFNFRLVLKGN